jgi:hypothetical protein
MEGVDRGEPPRLPRLSVRAHRLGRHLVGCGEAGTRAAHLLDGARRITGLHVHARYCVSEDGHFEARPERVEDRLAHAVVGGETTDPQVANPFLAKAVLERLPRTGVPFECRVPFAFDRVARRDDDCVAREPQAWMEPGAVRVLDAVRWPEAPVCLEVVRVGRMPVARRVDRLALLARGLDRMVQGGDDRVAAVHRKGTALAEVVLHVDNQQS